MKIDNKVGAKIPQELIGLFFEDINFAADGGLYAEMIENRSFEAKEAFGTPGNFYAVDDNGYAWEAYSTTSELPRMQFISGVPLSEVNPHYLRVTATEAGQGFANKAYDGICLKKGMDYKISFYARPVTYKGQTFEVRILKDDKSYGEAKVDVIPVAPYMPFSDLYNLEADGDSEWEKMIREAAALDDGKHVRQNDWVKYEMTLTAKEDLRHGKFVMILDGAGAVEFDLISMIPADAVEGVFRKDLFEALNNLKPGFIRFPGGCIIEGISLENRYRWKATVGDLKDRKYIPNLWAFQDDRMVKKFDAQRPDSHYGQTYGIGFFEYFVLCEKLGAKPLPVLNIGVSCQFRCTQIVPIDSPEFDEYVQDALDLIEFANGAEDSKWGSLRVKMGHKEPFNLTMLAIGNEQWETKYLDFYERYARFEKAIHDQYPEMILLGSAGPNVDMKITADAWKVHRKKEEEKPGYCYALDEHYYKSPEWMYDHYDLYDDYPRTVGVFAGEYAAHNAERSNNMEAALSEAALLCGVEKNANVVKLASYAPLFNNVNHSQWKPDMIWFDDAEVFLTPSYQVQKMFSENLGDTIVPLGGQEIALKEQKIYVSLTKDVKGAFILKVVNGSEEDYTLPLELADGSAVCATAQVQTLKSTGACTENRPEPTEIVEETVEVNGSIVLKAKSFSMWKF